MFFLSCCFVAGLGLRPYGLCGSAWGAVLHASEDFISVLLFRGRAWLAHLWPLRLGSSRVGASRRPRTIRKILFSLCCFVAGLGLCPIWRLRLGSSRLGANQRARIIRKIVFLSCCFVAGLGLRPYGLCGSAWGGVLHDWAQTGGPELFGRFYAVSRPGLACAPMAFAAGFFPRGGKPTAQNNSDDFMFIMFFVAGLGLFPMGFAVGFLTLGRKPAGPNNSEDFIFVVLFP